MLTARMPELAVKRISIGWTRSDLARAAKLSRSVVVRAEQGRGTSPKSAKMLADALNTSVQDIFEFKQKETV